MFATNVNSVVQTKESLGFVVNKVILFWFHVSAYYCFGFVIDSVEFKVFLIEEKMQKISLKAQTAFEQRKIDY